MPIARRKGTELDSKPMWNMALAKLPNFTQCHTISTKLKSYEACNKTETGPGDRWRRLDRTKTQSQSPSQRTVAAAAFAFPCTVTSCILNVYDMIAAQTSRLALCKVDPAPKAASTPSAPARCLIWPARIGVWCMHLFAVLLFVNHVVPADLHFQQRTWKRLKVVRWQSE